MMPRPSTTLRGVLRHNEPMSAHVSWRAGGPAQSWYQPADLNDMAEFLRGLSEDVPIYCVGLGSNLLVRDGGLAGVVLSMHGALKTLRLEEPATQAGMIYAEAGVALPKLARFAANHDLIGAEFMAGIPGTLGGGLAMNAGCYGSDTWDVVCRVLTMNRRGEIRQRERSGFHIGYREVVGLGADEWFVAGWLALAQGDGKRSREAITTLLEKRIASQPLGQPNAGSVFRNPPDDHAARLIEECGLKGFRIGGAQVSEKHANFIINQGHASAADIERLIAHVHDTVLEQQKVDLACEVRIVGQNREEMQ